MSSETLALIAIIVAAASECIALNPKLRSNSVIQLLMAGLALHSQKMNLPTLKKDGRRPQRRKTRTSLNGMTRGFNPGPHRHSWLVRAILTLNYVSIPGLEQRQIDPTFIASVFTGCLASFNIQTSKKKEEKEDNNQKKVTDQTDSPK